MNSTCVFCKIIQKTIPSTIIQENHELIVITDINPQASVHYLIIPKKHFSDVRFMQEQDQLLLGSMMMMAKKLSENLSGNQEFKLVINNGASTGQSVFHLHMHFLAGSKQNHL